VLSHVAGAEGAGGASSEGEQVEADDVRDWRRCQ